MFFAGHRAQILGGSQWRDKQWRDHQRAVEQNVVFSQTLALCPAMAVTTSGTNGSAWAGDHRGADRQHPRSIRRCDRQQPGAHPGLRVLIATLVTIVDMAMNAWMHELYVVLGLFIALIVVNCRTRPPSPCRQRPSSAPRRSTAWRWALVSPSVR